MPGEMTLLDAAFDNLVQPGPGIPTDFGPFQVVDIDPQTNTLVQGGVGLLNFGTGVVLASAGSECIGVVADDSKLGPDGIPVQGSGVNVRLEGIARVIAAGAVTPGHYVAPAAGGTVSDIAPGGRGAAPFQLSAALTPVAVAPNTTAEQTFNPTAFAGLAVGDVVLVTKPAAQAGLGIVGARVASTGHLAVNFVNSTAGAITPTAGETYVVTVIRGAGEASGPVAVVGRALTGAAAPNDTILVKLQIGARY